MRPAPDDPPSEPLETGVPVIVTTRVPALPPLSDRLIATGAELALVPAFVFTALNSAGSLSFLATQPIKIASIALGLAAAVIVLVKGRAAPRFPFFVGMVALLCVAFLITSLMRDIPQSRMLLLGQYLALVIASLIWLSVRPSRLITVLYTSSLVHLVLARVFPTAEQWSDGLTRLSGGSHPITLGFEACAVALTTLVAMFGPVSAAKRVLLGLVAAYAVYILVEAFSRQSLIAMAIALVVLAIALPGAFRWVRAFATVAIAFAVVALLGGDGIASLLGANQLTDLSTATGRTDIWSRVLPFFSDFAGFGYGYAALNDAHGPDLAIYFASGGETAENSILQILLDIGVAGGLVWATVLIVGLGILFVARGQSRVLALATVPVFLSSLLVASSLGDGGMQWWWFLALVAEAGASAAVRRPRGRPAPRAAVETVVV